MKEVRIESHDRLWDYIGSDATDRIVDIGCHRGEHIRDILRVQFPGATILGIEPKDGNFRACLSQDLPRVSFLQADCRLLTEEMIGTFDLIWCFGLIYHLDDPALLLKAMWAISHRGSAVLLEGHVATEGEQACLSHPNPPIVARAFDGREYWGKAYQEFAEGFPDAMKDLHDKASLDNNWAFWLTWESLLDLCAACGFSDFVEFRSSDPPLGPGLFHPEVDPVREWSRRLLLMRPHGA